MHDPFTPLKVSEAIASFNETMSTVYPAVLVEGEVASFKVNHGKFAFFDIKESSSSLGCFMMAFQLKFPIEDGMKVRVLAEPKLTDWGKFSLTVREVVPVGEGSLKKAYEILKAKLEAEGLFDEARKRPLPVTPRRIGVVSSEQAAGWADFQKVLQKRWSGLEILLTHVPVQGVAAPAEIIGALDYFNELAEPVEVIAVIRGGGSLDDLAAFNHEGVVRAVAASRAPTIVGVGHETDTTLVDLAADVRAATPSQAAEILVQDKAVILDRLRQAGQLIDKRATNYLGMVGQEVTEKFMQIDRGIDALLQHKEQTLQAGLRTLRQLDPKSVLRRGYSLVYHQNTVLTNTANATIGDDINITLKDGEIGAKITHVSK